MDRDKPLVGYYRTLAAYHLALLRMRTSGAGDGELLDACLDHGEQAARASEVAAEAWILVGACAGLAAPASSNARKALETAVAGFARRGTSDGPRWGEAEAQARLGALYLEAGDARRARDCIEQALLVAPQYKLALALKNRLSSLSP
jgi:tetratricopeptide (TPR) repeat protein